jgi:hypothetical protein
MFLTCIVRSTLSVSYDPEAGGGPAGGDLPGNPAKLLLLLLQLLLLLLAPPLALLAVETLALMCAASETAAKSPP